MCALRLPLHFDIIVLACVILCQNIQPFLLGVTAKANKKIAHKEQEPIFITKNGYSGLVVMSSELYDSFARINRIDQTIYESEKEMLEGGEAIDLDDAFHARNK
jgi:PHD/YefM family antitoxin component YafN of YafNO toxin-antitoxin module